MKGNKEAMKEKLSPMGKVLAQLRREIKNGYHLVPKDLNYNLTRSEVGPVEPLGKGCFGYSCVTYAYSQSLDTYVWVSTVYYHVDMSTLKDDELDHFMELYNEWAFKPFDVDAGDALRSFMVCRGCHRSQTYDKYREFMEADYRWPLDRRRYCRPNFVEHCVYRDFPDSMLE